jgi:hypothetical protein
MDKVEKIIQELVDKFWPILGSNSVGKNKMELKNLQKHIRTLATLEETNSPVISYYLNREPSELTNRLRLTERGRVLRQSLWGRARHDFEETMHQIVY